MANSKTHFIGLWYFSDRVTEEQLKQLAVSWAKDSNYLHIYIRRIDPDEPDKLSLGFTYQTDNPKSYESYFQKTVNDLKKEFGDLLVGWNIASTARLIKG